MARDCRKRASSAQQPKQSIQRMVWIKASLVRGKGNNRSDKGRGKGNLDNGKGKSKREGTGKNNGKKGKQGFNEMEGHDHGSTESQTSEYYTERTDIHWETFENWMMDWRLDTSWEDTASKPGEFHARRQHCALSGCNERHQGDQNEMMSWDDSRFRTS